MNFEQLKTLHAVVESGSINEAAKLLFKTQPAVSMTLKRLEQDVGFELFNRQGYRLELTPKGKIFFDKSKIIMAQMTQLKSLSESFTRGDEHEVKIAIEDTANLKHVLQILKPVQRQFPDTQLNINCVHMLNSLTELNKENVDLAITPWLVTFESIGDFESKRIGDLNFWYCMHNELAAQHGIFSECDVTPEKLNAIPQITPAELTLDLENTNIMKKISRSIIKIDEMRCFLAALDTQLGWGPITEAAWSAEMAQNYVRFNLDMHENMASSEIRIVKNRSKILGPCAQKIWDSMAKQTSLT